LAITNKDGVVSEFLNRLDGSRYDPLQPYDTVIIQFDVPMQSFEGFNQLRLEVNPDNNQPEWLHFNNFLYKQFYVKYPPLCPGASSVVSTDYLQGAASFQWQADNGSGYNDLADNNEVYTGVNAASLSINHPPTFLYGTKYRCRITTADAIRYSPEYILTFAVQWKNLVDNTWENPNNWNCNTLPDEYTDVIIAGDVTAYPEVNAGATAVCRKLYLRPGTTIQINAGGLLEIKGPSDNP
jgi:hypothetical protein